METQAILRRGWEVLAIDYDPEAAAFAPARLAGPERDRLTFRTQDFTEIDELPPSDLIHAAWALPFAGDRLTHLWGVLVEALNPGGWLACELFGDRDSEAQDPDVATLTGQQVDQLLEPLDVVSLETVERDSMSFTGTCSRWWPASAEAGVVGAAARRWASGVAHLGDGCEAPLASRWSRLRR